MAKFPLFCFALLIASPAFAIMESEGDFERHPRMSNTAAFAIVDNPPDIVQNLTVNYVHGLLNSYEDSAILEPSKGTAEEREKRVMAFALKLIIALRDRDAVDIFILSHTNTNQRLIEEIPPDLRRKIRLVYNSGCHNASDAKDWGRLGIGAYVGHPGQSCSPIFLDHFKENWWAGMRLRDAVDDANRRMRHDIKDSILGDVCLAITDHGTRDAAIKSTWALHFGNPNLTIASRYRPRPKAEPNATESVAATERAATTTDSPAPAIAPR